MAIRGLLFDLYGTLVTRGEGWRAYRELIFTLAPWRWSQARRAALTLDIPDIVAFRRHFAGRFGPPDAYFERMVVEGLDAVALFDATLDVLDEARRRGLALALVSNLAAPYKQPVYRLGLAERFDALVFSCEVGHAKPDLAIFRHAAAQLELAPHELVMIGDSRHDDIRGARAAGIAAIHIDRRGRGDVRDIGEIFAHPLLRG